MAGSNGRVILLIGPSCAGKSTLTKALQALSPEPYLAQSLDGLFAAVPDEWGGSGRRTLEGFFYDWSASPADGRPAVRRIGYGPIGWTFLQGFHRAVAAYAEAGVDVVVDDMLLDLAVLTDWAHALRGVPALLVNVTAPKAELLRREAERQLHPTPGLVAGHFDLHQAIAADAVIDTSALTPPDAARSLLDIASSSRTFTALHAFQRP